MAAQIHDPDDAKLVTLSKATRARNGAAEGAAVRDLDGRTYTASTVELSTLQLSALSLAVAMAVSSGARGLEAAAVVTATDDVRADDVAVVRELAGTGVQVIRADVAGAVQSISST